MTPDDKDQTTPTTDTNVIVILNDKLKQVPPRVTSPTTDDDPPTADQRSLDTNTTGSGGPYNYSDGSFLPYTPRHSDFTIPTSNKGLLLAADHEADRKEEPRRSIFGNAVQRKYKMDIDGSEWGGTTDDDYAGHHNGLLLLEDTNLPPPSGGTNGGGLYQALHHREPHRARQHFMSDVTLPEFPSHHHAPTLRDRWQNFSHAVASLFNAGSRRNAPMYSPPPPPHHHHHHHHHTRRRRPHETVHAQSLLLGLAFCAVWSANNVMAPNLTEMADYFGLQDPAQRDLYLGSYCALATGVFSFPIAAGIGVLADFMSRQRLFCITVAGGGLAAIVTARARSYPVLFFTRLLNGGFMAGSTPVVFSFLGDLFAVEERNAASSGLTAMMGLGIILGQVYAGIQGPEVGWQHPFYVTGFFALALAFLCLLLVQEPERGGKEKVLQDMIRAGTRYDRKLTWSGFWHTVTQNESNSILLWQGFFSSLPWGVIFVFLNDYLSQERGFSVPAATYLVFLFGLGCAAGGVLGGYWGQVVQRYDRTYLPIFMAVTTLLGIAPFVCLLNTHFTRAHGIYGIVLSISSGLVASLPSVNVRPCLINVNPPESRGASLTAANLLISLGRGVGPSCVTLMGSIFQTDRRFSINVTLVLFWVISAIQLVMLARTLPNDQDTMEAELASYAQAAMEKCQPLDIMSPNFSVSSHLDDHDDGDASIEVSIEDRITYFDGTAARQTLLYVKEGMQEFRQSLAILPCACGEILESSEEEDSSAPSPNPSLADTENAANSSRRVVDAHCHSQNHPHEGTPLIV